MLPARLEVHSEVPVCACSCTQCAKETAMRKCAGSWLSRLKSQTSSKCQSPEMPLWVFCVPSNMLMFMGDAIASRSGLLGCAA